MTQLEFDKLLEKYLAGQCSPAEEHLVEEWTEKQINTSPFPLTLKEEIDTKKRLKRRIDDSTVQLEKWSIRFSFYKLGIAACFLGLIGFGIFFAQKERINTEGGQNSKIAGIELSNTTSKEQEFKLKDGTKVTLKSQSSLTYLENFGENKRVVFLKGEGFFQVKRDTTKPFLVYAGNLVTEVLGTSFIVKSYEDGKATEIVVKSGRVMVYENQQGKSSKRVVLTPNLKVTYAKDIGELKPNIVDNPIVLTTSVSPTNFVFDKMPLQQVLDKLKLEYGIDVFLKNSGLKHCVFTGDLNGLTLYEQVDLICKTIDAQFQKYETAIWIDGEGCL